MEIHLGVIRDRQGIYEALVHSQSTKRQLAICFDSGGKLLVKICIVANIVGKKDGMQVTLQSPAGEKDKEMILFLKDIQSIYPIRDFLP